MFPLLNQTGGHCLRQLQHSFTRLSLRTPSSILGTLPPSRDRITISNPRLRNPVWFVRKNRTVHNDYMTGENRGFIQEVLHDTYGVPSLVKGVPSFRKPAAAAATTAAATTAAASATPTTTTTPAIEDAIDAATAAAASVDWTAQTRRCGAIARKIGQYPLWKKDGTKIRTTLLQIVDNHVVKYTPPEQFKPAQVPRHKHLGRFGCVLVGAESTDPSLLTKEYCGLFRDTGVQPKRILGRFIVSPQSALAPGTPIDVSHFRVGDFVDVRGKTVDRGFQGVCKRWGFKGMPASHGVTKTHRRGGNIGSGGTKARVMPGTKMPGHMGNRWRVSRGLKIWRINTKYNVMWVTGSGIAGETNGMCYVFDTMLPRRRPSIRPPFPTASAAEAAELPENVWDEELHDFRAPTIAFQPE